MSSVVVDASVAAKWFFPEDGARAALRLLDGRRRLLAPDPIHAEIGNIVWKRQQRGLLDADEAAAIIEQFLVMPLEIHEGAPLLGAALDLAMSTQCTVYDCLYLALAINQNARFVTADERLVNALAHGPLARHLRLLGGRR